MSGTREAATVASFETASDALEQLMQTPSHAAKVTDTQKLRFYALFKQATGGPCTTPQPSMIDVRNRAKWNAWHQCGGMSASDAKRQYVELLLEVAREAAPEIATTIRAHIENQVNTANDRDDLPPTAPDTASSSANASPSRVGGAAVVTPVRSSSGSRLGPVCSSTPRSGGSGVGLEGLRLLAQPSAHEAVGSTGDDDGSAVIKQNDVATNRGRDPGSTLENGHHRDPHHATTLSDTLTTLQAELRSTTNRVRELEFRSRVDVATAPSTGLTSGQLALVLLWPVAVTVGWELLRPRRPDGRR